MLYLMVVSLMLLLLLLANANWTLGVGGVGSRHLPRWIADRSMGSFHPFEVTRVGMPLADTFLFAPVTSRYLGAVYSHAQSGLILDDWLLQPTV